MVKVDKSRTTEAATSMELWNEQLFEGAFHNVQSMQLTEAREDL